MIANVGIESDMLKKLDIKNQQIYDIRAEFEA